MISGRGGMGTRKHRQAKKDGRTKSKMAAIRGIRREVEMTSERRGRVYEMFASLRALFSGQKLA